MSKTSKFIVSLLLALLVVAGAYAVLQIILWMKWVFIGIAVVYLTCKFYAIGTEEPKIEITNDHGFLDHES